MEYGAKRRFGEGFEACLCLHSIYESSRSITMNRSRQTAGLWIAGFLVLIAVVKYQLFHNTRPEPQHSGSVIPVATPIADVPPSRIERSEVVEIPAPPPSATPEPKLRMPMTQPLLPAAIQALATRYYTMQNEEAAASAIVNTNLEKDPELTKVIQAKLNALEKPLMFIAMAQALDDPGLRPVLIEIIDKNYLILQSITQEMSDREVSPQARSTNEAVAYLKSSEAFYQNEYRRLVAKMEIDEALAQAYAKSQASKTVMRYLQGYLFDQGYNYLPDRRLFEAIRKR